ncbi:MAG: hypothetical protein RPT25_05770 [Cycloclasticus sp.]
MKSFNRSAITILGTDEFLKWVIEAHPELHRWDLDSLNHHPNVYMVEMEDQNLWGECFEIHYYEIFKNEVGTYIYDGAKWPEDISFELFNRWFTYLYHESAVYDLCDKELEVFDE